MLPILLCAQIAGVYTVIDESRYRAPQLGPQAEEGLAVLVAVEGGEVPSVDPGAELGVEEVAAGEVAGIVEGELVHGVLGVIAVENLVGDLLAALQVGYVAEHQLEELAQGDLAVGAQGLAQALQVEELLGPCRRGSA